MAKGVTDPAGSNGQAKGVGRKSTQFRLTPELHQRLADAAESYGLPVNYLAARLLTEALDNLVPAAEFRLTRLARMPSGRCCDNGFFGVDHECQKQEG